MLYLEQLKLTRWREVVSWSNHKLTQDQISSCDLSHPTEYLLAKNKKAKLNFILYSRNRRKLVRWSKVCKKSNKKFLIFLNKTGSNSHLNNYITGRIFCFYRSVSIGEQKLHSKLKKPYFSPWINRFNRMILIYDEFPFTANILM